MPTYDYVCDACDHKFDLFQSITESAKRKCPECGKRSLRRLIGTGAAIIFKGSGFYATDYRSESYKKGAEAAKKLEQKSSGEKGSAEKGKDQKSSSKPSSKNKGQGKKKGHE